jgi:hypothetical protein
MIRVSTSKGQDSGFRVQGSGYRVQGSGFRVQGSGFRVWFSRVQLFKLLIKLLGGFKGLSLVF